MSESRYYLVVLALALVPTAAVSVVLALMFSTLSNGAIQ